MDWFGSFNEDKSFTRQLSSSVHICRVSFRVLPPPHICRVLGPPHSHVLRECTMTCVSRRKICMTWPESLLGWSASEISPRTERNREKGCISPSSQSIRLEQKNLPLMFPPFSPPENLLHCQKLCIVTFCPKNGGRGDFFGHFAPFSCYQLSNIGAA